MSKAYQPWIDYPHIWRSESAYLSFIRGGIRRYLWSKNPIKLEFEKESRVPIVNDNPRSSKRFPTVAGGKCEMCEGLFKQKDMEVDHRTGEHSLRSFSDIQSFVEGIVFVRKEDLAMLCKPCHGVKSYAERYGYTIAESRIHKQVIEMDKKPVKQVVAFLTKHGYDPAKTKDKRKEQLVEHFTKESQK